MDKLTDDLLTIIVMYPGWISRREILVALDLPTLTFPERVQTRLRKLEACGKIESNRDGRHYGGLWKYRGTEKAWEG